MAAFLAIPLAVVVMVELRLAQIPNHYSSQREWIRLHGASVEIVNVGSSEAAAGIDPGVSRRQWLNLAFPAQSLGVGARLLLSQIDRLPRLRYLLIPISFFSFDLTIESTSDKWRNFYYSNFFGIRGDGDWAQAMDLRNYSLFFMHGRETSLQLLAEGKTDGADIGGWRWFPMENDPNANFSDEKAKSRVAQYAGTMVRSNRVSNLAPLQRLMDVAHARGITILFFTPPTIPNFSRYSSELWGQSIEEELSRLRNRYSGGTLPFLDFRLDKRFISGDFHDFNHLNINGARKFTVLLEAAVEQAAPTGIARELGSSK